MDKRIRLHPETHARLIRAAGQLQGLNGRMVTLDGAVTLALRALDIVMQEDSDMLKD